MPRFSASPTRKFLIASALAIGAAGSAVIGLSLAGAPAHAQITVFDPSNYSQNLLTAARTLEQITNQVRSLQNEARMLTNQAKNLARIDFPELQELTTKLAAIDRLMGQAQGIDFRMNGLDAQIRRLFPEQVDAALTSDRQLQNAKVRLDTAMAGFRQTMGVQAQVVENVAADAPTLTALAAKSQGAQGSLQAQQATNQLLALVAKQQFQIQNLMAAQYRAESVDAARQAQNTLDARKAGVVATLDTRGATNPHALTPPPSPYLLSAGSVISASLLTGLRSDLPGLVTAQVTERVYDSPTGRTLLIPQGARLIGRYDSKTAFGQTRAQIVWQRLIMPDGSSLAIDDAPATDPSGYTGLEDKVDRHTWQLIEGVALSTLLGVGPELALNGDGDLVAAIRRATQDNVARAGDRITTRNLAVQPTITVRPGTPVRLIVNKDLVLAPWSEEER